MDDSETNKLEESDSEEDDRYNNLKAKTTKVENNINMESNLKQIQADIDANLQVMFCVRVFEKIRLDILKISDQMRRRF